jgi:alpha-L-fucosidase
MSSARTATCCLSVPVRGDGTIDSDETAFLKNMARWMKVNGEGIFGSRPWKIYGEGPAPAQSGMFNENRVNFGAGDIRFTVKDGALYAYFLGWPEDGRLVIQSLGKGTAEKPALLDKTIASVQLLGSSEKIVWTREADGLHVTLPAKKPCDDVFALKLVLK